MANSVRTWTVDSFATNAFEGNPAGVCLNEMDMTEELMQKIAAEMNISETAFINPVSHSSTTDIFATSDTFGLRWFTPTREVPLCGHGTMAAAKVIFDACFNTNSTLNFITLSGTLTVTKIGQQFSMSLPHNAPVEEDQGKFQKVIDLVAAELAVKTVWYSATTKKLVVRLDDSVTRAQLEALTPDTNALQQSHTEDLIRGVIVTIVADPTSDLDFISRYFAPWNGIPEDPVTGGAHTVLGPYWASVLGKTQLKARQCSPRGGDVFLTIDGDNNRVIVAGEAVIVLEGKIRC